MFELQLLGVPIHRFRIARKSIDNANTLMKAIFKNLPSRLKKQVNINSIQIFQNQLRVPTSELPTFTNVPIQVDLSDMQHLDLSARMISKLDCSNLTAYMNLKTLKLKGNKLQSIPDAFTQLNQLEILVLQNNLLTNLPNEIGNMAALRDLDVRNNPNLKDLPPSLSASNSLKCVMIAGTGIRKISSAFQAFVQNDGTFLVGETNMEFPPLGDPPLNKFLSKKQGEQGRADVKRNLILYWHDKRLERQLVILRTLAVVVLGKTGAGKKAGGA